MADFLGYVNRYGLLLLMTDLLEQCFLSGTDNFTELVLTNVTIDRLSTKDCKMKSQSPFPNITGREKINNWISWNMTILVAPQE